LNPTQPAITPQLLEAQRQCPRQDYLQRFWSRRTGRWYERRGIQWAVGAREEFTADQALALVIRDGAIISAQSQPSFVLRLLQGLRLGTGDQVLEVGFASGWLACLAAQVVGANGRVHGIEIDRETFDLALRRSGSFPDNFTYACGDLESVTSLPFDVVISTSAGESASEVFALMAEGGRASVAFRIPGGGDCTYLFQRHGSTITPYAAEFTRSVPASGELALGALAPLAIDASRLVRLTAYDFDMAIFGGPSKTLNYVALRAFIYRRSPAFVLASVRPAATSERAWLTFGIQIAESVAIVGSTGVFHAGGGEAVEALVSLVEQFAGMRRKGHCLVPTITVGPTAVTWVEAPELPRIFS